MHDLSTENRAELIQLLHDHLQQNSIRIKNSLRRGMQKIARRGCFIDESETAQRIMFEIENYRGTVLKKERGIDGVMVLDRILTTPYPVDYGYEFESPELVKSKGLLEYEDVIRVNISSEFSTNRPQVVEQQLLLQEGYVIGQITMIDSGQLDNKKIVVNTGTAHTRLSVADIFAVELQISNYLDFCKYYKVTSDAKLTQIFTRQADDSNKINQFIKIVSLDFF